MAVACRAVQLGAAMQLKRPASPPVVDTIFLHRLFLLLERGDSDTIENVTKRN